LVFITQRLLNTTLLIQIYNVFDVQRPEQSGLSKKSIFTGSRSRKDARTAKKMKKVVLFQKINTYEIIAVLASLRD